MNASSSSEDEAADIVLLRQAILEGNTIVSAAISTFLSTARPPEVTLRAPFNFNSLSNEECINKFRFEMHQIVQVVQLFELEGIQTRERTTSSGVEGLCIVLYKLTVPIRWVDLESFFGRDSSGLSNLFLHVLVYIDTKYARLLMFNHACVAQNLQSYADAVFDAGGGAHPERLGLY
ncbi:hypothetical protein JG687_00008707 [Phytophthora cactorum]|uniref:Uncharacterized protein n=1 Tax=Phytophthora cactorum TaxID=29920 RepID=A0A8T1UDL0_9STRA|nr:hypothetical protein JG687_00008707 [Phytophthora cactorum]